MQLRAAAAAHESCRWVPALPLGCADPWWMPWQPHRVAKWPQRCGCSTTALTGIAGCMQVATVTPDSSMPRIYSS